MIKNILNQLNFSLIFYLFFLISCFSYLLGFFLKDFRFTKIKLLIVNKSLSITLIIFILGFFINTSELKSALFTFSSVYFAFWLSMQVKNKEEILNRNKETKTISTFFYLIWQELNFNLTQLDFILNNFFFPRKKEEITGTIKDYHWNIVINKIKIMSDVTELFKKDSYKAYINSNLFPLTEELINSKENKLEIINGLEYAYNELEYLKSYFLQTYNGLKSNLLTEQIVEKIYPGRIDKKFSENLQEELEAKLTDAIKESYICRNYIQEAIIIIEKYSSILGISISKSEIRDIKLTDAQQKKISAIFDPPPNEAYKNPFRYMREKNIDNQI